VRNWYEEKVRRCQVAVSEEKAPKRKKKLGVWTTDQGGGAGGGQNTIGFPLMATKNALKGGWGRSRGGPRKGFKVLAKKKERTRCPLLRWAGKEGGGRRQERGATYGLGT